MMFFRTEAALAMFFFCFFVTASLYVTSGIFLLMAVQEPVGIAA